MFKFSYKEPYLYKDKNNKKWCVRYSIRYDGDTEFTPLKEYGRLYFNKSLNTIKDLKVRDKEFQRLVLMVELDLKAGIDKKQPSTAKAYIEKQVQNNKKYTFDYCLDFYLKQKGYVNPIPKKEKSAQTLSMFFKNQFRPFLEKNNLLNDVRDIKKPNLLDFVNFYYLNDDPDIRWKNNTYNNKKSYLGSFFSLLFDEEIITDNPVPLLKGKPKDKTRRFGVFTREERDLLFEYLNKNNYTISVISKTVYYSYIRFSEVERLTVEDFDFIGKRIRVDADNAKAQNDKLDRYVKMRKPLNDTLTEYLNRFEHQPQMFMFGKDKRPSPYKIGKGWQKQFDDALKNLRLEHPNLFKKKNLSPYALKHSGVSHFIEDNIGKFPTLTLLQFVQQQCRHSDFSETQKYWEQLGFPLETVDSFYES